MYGNLILLCCIFLLSGLFVSLQTTQDILERFTNGTLQATPHRVLNTVHARHSIIRFNAVAPDTMVAPLPAFVSAESPAKYTPVTMGRHMETTLSNLAGRGRIDTAKNRL